MKPRTLFMQLIVMVLLASPLQAADVSAAVSSEQVYSGVPFSLVVTIGDVETYDVPILPSIPGVRAMGPPGTSRRSMTNIVNGRVTQRVSVELTWTLIATEPGTILIPPLTVVADGKTQRTSLLSVKAVRPRGGDRLDAEIEVGKRKAYVGEAVELTLKVWIKPYEDPLLDGPLPSQTMWSLVETERSGWGEFKNVISELARGRRSRVAGRLVERPGKGGQWYLFEFKTRAQLERTGRITPSQVVVLMRYPKRLGRSRSVFSRGQLEITDDEQLVAEATAQSIEVAETPVAGRPPWYTGATGRYDLEVTASPTTVAVGDPITLTMTITDVGGSGRLELVAPPALDTVDALRDGFRLTTDPLAGTVTGRQKVFTDTIRAKNDQVDAVPAIPYAFFDPDREAYVTVESAPVPLIVYPTRTVGAGDVVGADLETPPPTDLTELAGGLLANETAPDRLLVEPRAWPRWPLVLVLILPPLLLAGFLGRIRQAERASNGGNGLGRRRAVRRARDRLDAAETADDVAVALTGYIADRCGVNAAALTRGEVTTHLAATGLPAATLTSVASVLERCDRARYATADDANVERLVTQAKDAIDGLERSRWR